MYNRRIATKTAQAAIRAFMPEAVAFSVGLVVFVVLFNIHFLGFDLFESKKSRRNALALFVIQCKLLFAPQILPYWRYPLYHQ